jgi:cytochrome c5
MSKLRIFRNRSGIIAAIAALTVISGCGGGSGTGETTEAAPAFKMSPYANIDAGKTNFMMVCSACHGKDALGLPNLGKQLVDNEYLKSISDAEFYELLVTGRGTEHPLNTTGVAMPPKGGNPAFSEKDLHSVMLYVRGLSK